MQLVANLITVLKINYLDNSFKILKIRFGMKTMVLCGSLN